MSSTAEPQQDGTNLDIRYGQPPALYVSQFLLSASPTEVRLDCSSGLELSNQQSTLPIHTRLAMPISTARRLADLLNQLVANHDAQQSSFAGEAAKTGSVDTGSGNATIGNAEASLPTFEGLHA